MKANSSWGNDTTFYRLRPWLKLREVKVNENPICELCESVGVVSETKFIDHILNRNLFKDFELELVNLQSLCPKCHSQKTSLEIQFKTKEAYLKALEDGKLQYVCTVGAKEKLLKFLQEKKKAL